MTENTALVSRAPEPASGPFYTAAGPVTPQPHSGLTIEADLSAVPDSFAPSTASGKPVAHVHGPRQMPVDPVAAGLDTSALVVTREQDRIVTPAPEAAGQPPSTYVQHGTLDPHYGARPQFPQPATTTPAPTAAVNEGPENQRTTAPVGVVARPVPEPTHSNPEPPHPAPEPPHATTESTHSALEEHPTS